MFLSKKLFSDKQTEYTKTVNVIITETVSRELFGNRPISSKPFQITIKTKIQYDVDADGEDEDEDEKKPMAYNFDEGGANKITVQSQAAKGFSKKALMEMNEAARMSVYAIKTAEQDFIDHDQSIIDPILDDDNEGEFQNEDAPLNAFLDQVNENFLSDAVKSETDPNVLKEKCKEAVMAVFQAQKIYYTSFYKTQSLNKFLRELLVKYNGKYRVISKKYNVLKQEFESLNIKKNLTALNNDENKRIVAAMEHSASEMEIYRKLFNVDHDVAEVDKFKANLASIDEGRRNLLKKVMGGIYYNNQDSIPENQKLSFNYVIGKYKLDQQEEYHIQQHNEEEAPEEFQHEGDGVIRVEKVREDVVEEVTREVVEVEEITDVVEVEERREEWQENVVEEAVEETVEIVEVEGENVE